jgi:type II secretory pathway pseudopilin PulG
MSPSLRSEGWVVQPSFVPYGPTAPVTLLVDDTGLTQLAGEPAVAWQSPWSELSNMQLTRFARGMALFATIGGVRYSWRKLDRIDHEQLSDIVAAHGGQVVRQRRRGAVYAVVAVVLLASLAGGIGAWFSRGSAGAKELSDATAVNLTLRDLPSSFSTADGSALADLFPSNAQTTVTTTTTYVAPPAKFEKIIKKFQACMGVSNARDRVYGEAGQTPLYQVTSPFFTTSKFNGMELATTTQYYSTPVKVRKDTAEMTKKPFGGCFVASQANILQTYAEASASSDVTSYQPKTYEKGWSRGGVATLTLPEINGPLHLVIVEITSGHYEVTLGALVASWPKSRPFISNLVSTLLARMNSTTAAAV